MGTVTDGPWIAKEINPHWMYYNHYTVETPKYKILNLTDDDADFIAKSHTAWLIMQNRKWGITFHHDNKWRIELINHDGNTWWPDSFSAWCLQHGFDDPYEALIQADAWYREFVEG